MTVLSTDAIRQRLDESDPAKRLIVSPLLDAEGQTKPGQASIDVRLGFEFCLVSASDFGLIDEYGEHGQTPASLAKLYQRIYVPLGSSLVIHPHQFMLAQTFEYLRLPSDLSAMVVGRSTWGRLGLIVATAIGIHPNFAGSLTFELRNLGEAPLTLYPCQTIAQLFLQTVENRDGTPAGDAAAEAQYAGTVDMVPRNLSSEPTSTVLKNLIKRYNRISKS